MKTWNDYKEYVKTEDPERAEDLREAEELAKLKTEKIEQRKKIFL